MSIINLNELKDVNKKEEPAIVEHELISNGAKANIVTDETNLKNQVSDKEEKIKNTKIVLDGPLSQIYTQALNVVYDNNIFEDANGNKSRIVIESTDSILSFLRNMTDVDNDDIDANSEELEDETLYVYVADNGNIEQEELVNASDKLRVALDSKKIDKTIVGLESNGSFITENFALLDKYSRVNGIKVCYSKNSVIKSITDYLSGKH